MLDGMHPSSSVRETAKSAPEAFHEALRGLTEHQRTIARLVGAGHTSRETADLLGRSVKTVEWDLTRIYRAVGVRSRTELASALVRHTTKGGDR
jgi:DNA-binding CsgD family transcriptional regulator